MFIASVIFNELRSSMHGILKFYSLQLVDYIDQLLHKKTIEHYT